MSDELKKIKENFEELHGAFNEFTIKASRKFTQLNNDLCALKNKIGVVSLDEENTKLSEDDDDDEFDVGCDDGFKIREKYRYGRSHIRKMAE